MTICPPTAYGLGRYLLKGDNSLLTNRLLGESFIKELSDCLHTSPFKIFAAVISKPDLKLELFPENPYVISLRICLQQIYQFLEKRNQTGRMTHFIFEKRGRKEDSDLELEFRRIIDGKNEVGIPFDGFVIHFVDKKTNSTGMQVADLTARPLGLSIFRQSQLNRAFALIERKIHRNRRYSRPSRGIFIP